MGAEASSLWACAGDAELAERSSWPGLVLSTRPAPLPLFPTGRGAALLPVAYSERRGQWPRRGHRPCERRRDEAGGRRAGAAPGAASTPASAGSAGCGQAARRGTLAARLSEKFEAGGREATRSAFAQRARCRSGSGSLCRERRWRLPANRADRVGSPAFPALRLWLPGGPGNWPRTTRPPRPTAARELRGADPATG